MARRSDKTADQTRQEVNEILNRVDQLPTLDNRPTDEILGQDQDHTASEGEVLARKTIENGASNAVEEFLKYRHRDWER